MPPVIQTAGQLQALHDSNPYSSLRGPMAGSLALYNHQRASYSAILKTQPAVRTVISFVARNIAQLGVGLFEKLTETDREKVTDHPFAAAMRQPNPADRRLTTYRLMHRTVWDVCAYDVAFWGLFDNDEVRGALGRPLIVPLRPDRMKVNGHLWPTGYEYLAPDGQIYEIPVDRVVYFQGSANLDDPLWGTPPIETLRRVIAEDEAAGVYREQFWRSGARLSGVIERPVEAPDWSTTARDRFKGDWDSLWTGWGDRAGGTPILEDGMSWKEAGTSDARSAQYIEARKLSREEAASVWHVDPIWVGIAQAGLSFSSVVERHQALYQDTLGPWVVMLEQDLTGQALPRFEDNPARLEHLYTKLNIAEKLRGSLRDQADSLYKATGRPWLTVNEARALTERNDLEGGDGLAVPLNLAITGGGASEDLDEPATTPAVEAAPRRALARGVKAVGLDTDQHAALTTEHQTAHRQRLASTFGRQLADVLAALGAAGAGAVLDDVWDADRWDAELETDLLGLALNLAEAFGAATAEALAFEDLDTDAMVPYLAESSRVAAENINLTTADQLADALLDDEDVPAAVRHLFDVAENSRAETSALTRTTALAAFVAQDVAGQAGRSSKTWVVTSSNSRHPELDGETVPLGQPFSNGMAWPGDPVGGSDQTAGCTCLLLFE